MNIKLLGLIGLSLDVIDEPITSDLLLEKLGEGFNDISFKFNVLEQEKSFDEWASKYRKYSGQQHKVYTYADVGGSQGEVHIDLIPIESKENSTLFVRSFSFEHHPKRKLFGSSFDMEAKYAIALAHSKLGTANQTLEEKEMAEGLENLLGLTTACWINDEGQVAAQMFSKQKSVISFSLVSPFMKQ